MRVDLLVVLYPNLVEIFASEMLYISAFVFFKFFVSVTSITDILVVVAIS